MTRFNYYRVRTNWHKHPWVTRFLCWMGRHDYEAYRIDLSRTGFAHGDRVLLKCFYCGQKKGSSCPHE